MHRLQKRQFRTSASIHVKQDCLMLTHVFVLFAQRPFVMSQEGMNQLGAMFARNNIYNPTNNRRYAASFAQNFIYSQCTTEDAVLVYV